MRIDLLLVIVNLRVRFVRWWLTLSILNRRRLGWALLRHAAGAWPLFIHAVLRWHVSSRFDIGQRSSNKFAIHNIASKKISRKILAWVPKPFSRHDYAGQDELRFAGCGLRGEFKL